MLSMNSITIGNSVFCPNDGNLNSCDLKIRKQSFLRFTLVITAQLLLCLLSITVEQIDWQQYDSWQQRIAPRITITIFCFRYANLFIQNIHYSYSFTLLGDVDVIINENWRKFILHNFLICHMNLASNLTILKTLN